jgi:hypothetical protein
MCFCANPGCCDQVVSIPELGYRKPVKICQNCHKKFESPREKLQDIFVTISKMGSEVTLCEMNSIYSMSFEERDKLQKRMKLFEELIMQQLLRTDSISVPLKLRKKKKELIIKIQNLLTFIESVKNKLDDLCSVGNILVRNSPLRSPTKYDYKIGLKLVSTDPPPETSIIGGLCLSSFTFDNTLQLLPNE